MTDKNLDKKKKQKTQRLNNTYGISNEDWELLIKSQRGKCALESCSIRKNLAVDHIHVPGYKNMPPEEKRKYVRGLVCFRHNKLTIGGLEIDKLARKTLDSIIKYFSKYKMKGDL